MPCGKRIYTARKSPERGIVEGFSKIPTSVICDTMNRMSAMHPRIKRIARGKEQITAGPALTVRCRAGDNLALLAAAELCREGDIVVVDGGDGDSRAVAGGNLMAYLFYYKKAAALIIDGPLRDAREIYDWGFPVYATGVTPAGPFREGPGEVNVPISCGSMSVHPGDIVVCDDDGIVVIPLKDAAALLPVAEKFMIQDQAKMEPNKNGTADRSWIKESLGKNGFEIIEGCCDE